MIRVNNTQVDEDRSPRSKSMCETEKEMGLTRN